MTDFSREPLRKWLRRELAEPLAPVEPSQGEDGDGDFKAILLKQREDTGRYSFGMVFEFDPDRFEAPGASAELEQELLHGMHELIRSVKRGRQVLAAEDPEE